MADRELIYGQSGSVLYDEDAIAGWFYPVGFTTKEFRGALTPQMYITDEPVDDYEVPRRMDVDGTPGTILKAGAVGTTGLPVDSVITEGAADVTVTGRNLVMSSGNDGIIRALNTLTGEYTDIKYNGLHIERSIGYLQYIGDLYMAAGGAMYFKSTDLSLNPYLWDFTSFTINVGYEERMYNVGIQTDINYERAYFRWVANVFTIGTEKGGTGVVRAINIAASVTLGTLTGILKAASGVVDVATIGNSLSYVAPTLDTIQDIRTTATPQFTRLGLGIASEAVSSLYIYKSASDAVTGQKLLSGNLLQEITINAAHYHYGIYLGIASRVKAGITESGAVYAYYAYCLRNASGAAVDDSGTLGTLYGINLTFGHSNIDSGETPLTTNAYGLYVIPHYRTGKITNIYTIFMPTATVGGTAPDNYYSIYQQDPASKNWFAGRCAIGASTPIATASLYILGSGTDAVNGMTTLYNVYTYTQTANGAQGYFTHSNVSSMIINTGVTHSGYIRGSQVSVYRNYVAAGSDDAGTLNQLYGIAVAYGHWNNNALTTPQTTYGYGIFLQPYYKTGKITNLYGIYIATVSTGGTAPDAYYGIYQQDVNAKNFFAGSVGIGIGNPTSTLNVYKNDASAVSIQLYNPNADAAAEATFEIRSDVCYGQMRAFSVASAGGARINFVSYNGYFLVGASVGYYLAFCSNNVEGIRLDIAQNILFNTTTTPTDMTKGISMKSGVAPSAAVADCFQLYSSDRATGKAGLTIRSEDGTSHIFSDYIGLGTVTPDQFCELQQVETITGVVTDGYAAALRIDPGYTAATAQTVTRHNYIDIQDVSAAGAGPAAITDSAVLRFDAAAGTHKAVAAASTKTTPGAVDAWVKINVNGTLHYIPAYLSMTT